VVFWEWFGKEWEEVAEFKCEWEYNEYTGMGIELTSGNVKEWEY